MPKTKLQNIIFTLLMALVMVYAMICYNIALDKGGLSNEVFLLAFHELVIMWPVAVILELFVVEKLAQKLGEEGIQISRRTVAKYRMQMNILDAAGRRGEF